MTLPKGWAETTLDALIGAGGLFSDGDWVESKDQDPSGEYRLLQLADVGDGVFLDRSSRFVNGEKFAALRCTELKANDVLIARMPEPLGRACVMPRVRQRCLTVVDVAIVRPGSTSVRPRWLMHFLNAPGIRHGIERAASGTTRNRVARSKLAALTIPVPPLAEQRRIADKLDALLARLDTCRARLDRVPEIMRRFRQAVLAAATSGELTREWRAERDRGDKWRDVTVGELLERVEAGQNVQCEERPPEAHERGLVKISAVTWGRYDDAQSKTLPRGQAVPEHTRIMPGDFLLSRANTIELVGACVIVDHVTRPVHLSDKVLRLVMREELKPWLLIVLRSPQGRREIEARATGNQLSMRNLSQGNLRDIPVPLPDEDERAEIARRVTDLLAMGDRIEASLQAARENVERATPALLAKAFRGELVPQDPTDEPAGVLLERVRRERAAAQAPARGSKITRRSGKTRGLARARDLRGHKLRNT